MVCSQSLFRFVYFGDDCFCGSGPDEGPGSLVTAFDVAGNGVNEFVDAAHSESLQSASGQFSKEALDEVEPGCRGGNEVEGDPGMLIEPLPDLGVLVSGVVVEDHVDV